MIIKSPGRDYLVNCLEIIRLGYIERETQKFHNNILRMK